MGHPLAGEGLKSGGGMKVHEFGQVCGYISKYDYYYY